jgi:hypothetical protein
VSLIAWFRRAWRRFADDSKRNTDDYCLADILVLPLAGVAFSLWLLGTVPGASDAVAAACAVACMP